MSCSTTVSYTHLRLLILFLCTANLILGTDTAFDGTLYAVTHADLDGAAFDLLYRYAVRHYISKGAVLSLIHI